MKRNSVNEENVELEENNEMKIAYGTYAMPMLSLEEAILALAEMGYEGVEICISPRHQGSMPDEISGSRRNELETLLNDHGLVIPALMMVGQAVLAEDDAEHLGALEHMRHVCQLARDLGMRHPPVLAIGIGGRTEDWDEKKGRIVERLRDYADLAEREDFILAGEAHCGAAVDRSERVVWLFDTVNHPRIRFHFDIVHMFLAGEEIEDSVKTLVPYTAHTHITDARKHADGSFDLVLLGQGDLDSTRYVKAMSEAGWTDFITLEVSMRVWSKPDYDPYEAARFSYRSLLGAFHNAGAVS
ncbi:MAG: sugar phosphate isomerase/epimerase [Planctomycetota bacterium]|jgi:sugar phosphate isomerase/epimerase|nr:sugar phosphate isomerase/epimerase [Planctomycetota bacterium]